MKKLKNYSSLLKFYRLIEDLFLKYSNFYFVFLQNKMIRKRKFIPNLKRYFSNKLDEIEYRTLIQSYKITLTEAEKKFLNEKIKCSKKIKRDKEKGLFQREVFTCVLKNVNFFGHSGGIICNKRSLLESVSSLVRLKKHTRTVNSFFLKHRKMKGVYTSIMHIYRHNYYHWLIERIPRLYGIYQIKEPEINLIIPKKIPKWQLERLKIFLDNRFKILKIGYNEVWELEKFYFSSFYAYDCSAYMPKPYLDFIRNKVFNHFAINRSKKPIKRIFLSRNKMNQRRIINEDKLFELLRKYGFEKVHPQDLSFREQVELFNSAEIIVGMTGAGLSNIIFAEKLKLIVIYPLDLIITHFMLLCKALGFVHDYLIGFNQNEKNDVQVDLLRAENIITEYIN